MEVVLIPKTSLYWNVIAPLARRAISKRWGYELGKLAYEQGRSAYYEFLAEAPDFGEENPMLATFLESMVFVALWKGADGKLSVADLATVTEDVLTLAPLSIIGLVRNANRSERVLGAVLEDMRNNEAWAAEHEGEYEAAWRISFDLHSHDQGITYDFTRCPIAEFCAEHGMGEVTPVLCDIDHHTTRLIHARLIREHTLAEGAPSCDYWIVPDKDEVAS